MRLNVASLQRIVQGEAARRVRASGLDLVKGAGSAPPLPAAARPAAPAARRVCGHWRGLWWRPPRLAHPGAALRRGRRLEHLGDPLITRFCELPRLPTVRTVGNWLRQFTQTTVAPLVQLNHKLVPAAVKRLPLPG